MPTTVELRERAGDATLARARRLRRVRGLARAAPDGPAAPARVHGDGDLPRPADGLPAELRDPFLDAMMERLPAPAVLDYVRLNFDATAI